MNIRKRIGKWLLGNDDRIVEHRYITHNPKTKSLRSQSMFNNDNIHANDRDELHGLVTRNIVKELVEQAIESEYVIVETTYDARERQTTVRATMNLIEPLK